MIINRLPDGDRSLRFMDADLSLVGVSTTFHNKNFAHEEQ